MQLYYQQLDPLPPTSPASSLFIEFAILSHVQNTRYLTPTPITHTRARKRRAASVARTVWTLLDAASKHGLPLTVPKEPPPAQPVKPTRAARSGRLSSSRGVSMGRGSGLGGGGLRGRGGGRGSARGGRYSGGIGLSVIRASFAGDGGVHETESVASTSDTAAPEGGNVDPTSSGDSENNGDDTVDGDRKDGSPGSGSNGQRQAVRSPGGGVGAELAEIDAGAAPQVERQAESGGFLEVEGSLHAEGSCDIDDASESGSGSLMEVLSENALPVIVAENGTGGVSTAYPCGASTAAATRSDGVISSAEDGDASSSCEGEPVASRPSPTGGEAKAVTPPTASVTTRSRGSSNARKIDGSGRTAPLIEHPGPAVPRTPLPANGGEALPPKPKMAQVGGQSRPYPRLVFYDGSRCRGETGMFTPIRLIILS